MTAMFGFDVGTGDLNSDLLTFRARILTALSHLPAPKSLFMIHAYNSNTNLCKPTYIPGRAIFAPKLAGNLLQVLLLLYRSLLRPFPICGHVDSFQSFVTKGTLQ